MIGGIIEGIAHDWNQALNRELVGINPQALLSGKLIFHAVQQNGPDAGSGTGGHSMFMTDPRTVSATLGQGKQ